MSESPDPLMVSGGVGGIAVNLAELGAASEVLDHSARSLRDAESLVVSAGIRLTLGAALAPAAGARAIAALEALAGVLARLGEDVSETARDVGIARERYAAAEETTIGALLVWGLRLGLPGLPPVPAPAGWLPPHAALRPLGWALGGAPGTGVGAMVVPAGDAVPGPAPRGTAGLMAGISALYPAAGGAPGSIAVDRVAHADGRTSWVVLVPGTQTLAVGGGNPMDDATNLQAYTGAPTAVGAAVVTALGMAGARRSEPVLLAGHSQGGMVAMRVASDRAVRRHYRVTSVLTAGSPVGHIPTPAGVSVLHLEHATDVTPGLDLARNPDEADRVTVRRGGAGGPAAAHAMPAYEETAELVDASDHPSVVQWRARAGAVLGGDGATSTRTVYVVERQ